VTLSQPAPTGGTTVTLTSSLVTALTVPASVLVTSGATTATFTATATALISSDQNATIKAVLPNGSNQSVVLSITAAMGVSALQCAKSTLTSNMVTNCTVTLSRTAPAGGIQVSLSTSNDMLTAPPKAKVEAGANSAVFVVTAAAVPEVTSATVRAVYGSSAISMIISLSPYASAISQLTCSPQSVVPGRSGNCTITMTAPASASTSIVLRSTNAALVVPRSALVAAGSASASFQFTSQATLNGWAIVSAAVGGVTKTATITASSSPVSSAEPLLTCDQRHVSAGGSTICDVSFQPSDSQPVEFSITSSSENVKVPLTIRPRAGGSSVQFEVYADAWARQDNVTIEATSTLGSAQTSLAVLSPGAPLLKLPATQSVRKGNRAAFLVAAVDSQDLPLQVSSSGLPRGASFDPATGEVAWTPGDSDQSATIGFSAKDSAGLSTTGVVRVKVASDRPVISGMRNGAGNDALAACSPGARMTLVGTFSSDDQQAGVQSDGIRVRVNGEFAPVLLASAGEADFLCPVLSAGTPLSMTVEVGNRVSAEWRTVMAEAAPGLLSVNGSGRGQGLVVHGRGLAALPRFDRDGMPAIAGETIRLYATGINCENSRERLPLLFVGRGYQPITSVTASAFAGVCEVQAVIPEGIAGTKVEVFLETVRADATLLRSNTISLAVEEPVDHRE